MTASAAIQAAPPLSAEQTERLAQALDGLDDGALLWASGFVAGLAHARGALAATAPIQAETASRTRLTVLYGSQTGNARRLAETLAARAEGAGLAVRLLRADAYPLRELKDERLLYLVISTQGEGDPPEDSLGLVEFLRGRRAPALKQLSYAVLGLGDSSYPKFCAVGRELDARLAELGGTRLIERGDADLDIDAVAAPWLEQALARAEERLRREAPSATVTPLRRGVLAAPPAHTRERPYAAEVLVNQRISGRDSDRDVRHIELSLEGSGLSYEPGDALGVWPENAATLVDAVLDRLRLDPAAAVARNGETTLALGDWLRSRCELTRLSRGLVAAHAQRARAADLDALLADAEALHAWLLAHQAIDLFQRWPAAWTAEDLVAALPPLAPRLYSIASSRAEVAEEAHLTVALVEQGGPEGRRFGAASKFLADQAEGARVKLFVEANERFRLPADGSRDLIMIGPGTGVAPFCAFVQQRSAAGAGGRNWLFFGARRFREDFLYQLEWQRALKEGRLHRIDLAFSRDRFRDSPHTEVRASAKESSAPDSHRKTYVQQRLTEHGRAVYDWLEHGAHLYVCGAVAMGKDVHRALAELVARHGGRSPEAAEDYLRALQQQGRYARDVY